MTLDNKNKTKLVKEGFVSNVEFIDKTVNQRGRKKFFFVISIIIIICLTLTLYYFLMLNRNGNNELISEDDQVETPKAYVNQKQKSEEISINYEKDETNVSPFLYKIEQLPDFSISYSSDWVKTENVTYGKSNVPERVDLTLKKVDTEIVITLFTDFLSGLETGGFCFENDSYQVDQLTDKILRYREKNGIWFYSPGEMITDVDKRKAHARLIFSETYENCVATVDGLFTQSTLISRTGSLAKGAIVFSGKLQNAELLHEVDEIMRSMKY